MTLPTILTEGNEEEAARLLAAYYRRLPDGLPAYTGIYFNSWAGGGDSSENRDTITADDLIAVSFLAVDVCRLSASPWRRQRRDGTLACPAGT